MSVWADETHAWWPYWRKTSRAHGLEFIQADDTLWSDYKRRHPKEGHPWHLKVVPIGKYIQAHDDADYFLFSDCNDVIYSAGADELIEKFNAIGSPIVYSSERYCWPPVIKPEEYPAHSIGRFSRFLNSGFWMATREGALKLAVELQKPFPDRVICDQGSAVLLYLSGRLPIALDHENTLCYCNADKAQGLEFDDPRQRFKRAGTEIYPCCFHGNGAGNMRPFIEKLKL